MKACLFIRIPAAYMLGVYVVLSAQILNKRPWYVKALDPGPNTRMKMVNKVVWDGELEGCFGKDPDKAKQMFVAHNEEVVKVSKQL